MGFETHANLFKWLNGAKLIVLWGRYSIAKLKYVLDKGADGI